MPGPLLRKPPTAGGSLPTEGPDNPLDQVLRAVLTGAGIESGTPGDIPSTVGALSGAMIPFLPQRLLKMLRLGKVAQEAKPAVNAGDSLLRSHLYDELPEFAPVTHGVRPALDPEEALKEIELQAPKRRNPK